MKSHFDNPVGRFGAIRELDTLNGINELCIVGTPLIYLKKLTYLWRIFLDINLGTGGMLEMESYKSVNREWNSFSFQSLFIKCPLSKELQISIIESELIEKLFLK